MTTKRSAYDFYPTPEGAINSLLETLKKYNIDLGTQILEPCVGDGALIAPLHHAYPEAKISGFDIDNSHYPALSQLVNNESLIVCGFRDAGKMTKEDIEYNDTIITNPPFSSTQEILEHILELRNQCAKPPLVIILQRLGFLGSQKRHQFWNKYPPNAVWALSKRPSFTGTGTDAHEYGWFIWGDIGEAPPILAI